MSSLEMSPPVAAIAQWGAPSQQGGWLALAPVIVLDWEVHSHNRAGIEALYKLDSVIESFDDDDFDHVIEVLTSVLGTIDGYIQIRGTGTMLLRKIRSQRQIVSQAIEALKRGYAPGTVPSESDRLTIASSRLREIGIR